MALRPSPYPGSSGPAWSSSPQFSRACPGKSPAPECLSFIPGKGDTKVRSERGEGDREEGASHPSPRTL